jgi:hypothetical protein
LRRRVNVKLIYIEAEYLAEPVPMRITYA